MKTKALILSALILVPTAGAAAVQAAPTPTQDFRVSYTKAAPLTSSSVSSKTNLPQVLSDEELEGVTGEGFFTAGAGAVMMVDGVKRMVTDGRNGDYLGMALGAGTYFIGLGTFSVGVVVPSP